MTENYFSTQITVYSKYGLHARTAGQIVKEAQKFSSKITLRYADRTADAQSILDILLLGATQGSTVEFVAIGRDAKSAIQQLVNCVQRN